jgi:putative hydrolase of the HAD superfamily
MKGVIFDLGGVIIDLDESETVKRFAQLGNKSLDQVRDLVNSEAFKKFEKGLISETEFRDAVRSNLAPNASDDQIDECWNAMLKDIPGARIELLERLKEKYRLFLLSNTNSIHLKSFNRIVKEVTGHDSLQRYFTRVYYSHQVRMRKPDREIYELVLRENNLVAAETLFLDDNPANLEGAARVGIQTVHVTHPNLIFDIFHEN